MLADFQRSFASGLLNNKAAHNVRDDLRVDPLGFSVHAHHVRVSLNVAMENAFPVTRRVVGAEFFEEMASRFAATHPPTHGWLSAYGEGFPEFMGQYSSAAGLPYLPDLARIEWARVKAANAPDSPGLDLKSLALMDPTPLEGLQLKLHRAASLVPSSFPVFDIWQAHQLTEDDEHVPQISFANNPQSTLIVRAGVLEVGVALLTPGDAIFLGALKDDSPFGAACHAAVLGEANYDLGSRLGYLVDIRALAAFPGGQE
jgi:Putative DNA-binding domain